MDHGLIGWVDEIFWPKEYVTARERRRPARLDYIYTFKINLLNKKYNLFLLKIHTLPCSCKQSPTCFYSFQK
jgi:hypothetical protein